MNRRLQLLNKCILFCKYKTKEVQSYATRVENKKFKKLKTYNASPEFKDMDTYREKLNSKISFTKQFSKLITWILSKIEKQAVYIWLAQTNHIYPQITHVKFTPRPKNITLAQHLKNMEDDVIKEVAQKTKKKTGIETLKEVSIFDQVYNNVMGISK